MSKLIKIGNKIDNFIVENYKNRNLHIFLLTLIVALPVSIYMITAYSVSCKNNKVEIKYNENKDNCYCKNFVTLDSLQTYISQNEPRALQQTTQTVQYYNDQVNTLLNNNYQTILDIVFDINDLNLTLPPQINNINLQPLQVIALIPLSEFEFIEQSLKINQLKINTNSVGYGIMFMFNYNNFYTQCILTKLNSSQISTNSLNALSNYQLDFFIYQASNEFNILCGQQVIYFDNGVEYVFNYTNFNNLIKSTQFYDILLQINSSVVNQLENNLFNSKNPKYCIPDYCLVSDCFGYNLYSAIVIIATIVTFIYRFFYFVITIYSLHKKQLKMLNSPLS